MYKLFVAFRYLTRNWLNLVGIAAVAIGVLVLVCVLSVMKGFDEEFRNRLRATLSDLIIEPYSEETFEGANEMMAQIEKFPHVVACAPRYDGLALIKVGSSRRYGEYQGIDLARELKTTDFGQYWRDWRGRAAREKLLELVKDNAGKLSDVPRETLRATLAQMRASDFGLLLPDLQTQAAAWAKETGFDLAAAQRAAQTAQPEWVQPANPIYVPAFAGSELLVLGQTHEGKLVSLGVGDNVTIVVAKDAFDDRGFQRCQIAGAYRSGLHDYDARTIYLPIEAVQKLMSKPARVTSINIRLDNFTNAPEVRARLMGILTPAELAAGIEIVKGVLGQPDTDIRRMESRLRELREQEAAWWASGDYTVMIATAEIEGALYRKITTILRGETGVKPKSDDIEKIRVFQAAALEREKGGVARKFRISTWEDKRRTFLRAVWIERRIMGFILFFVILIAGFLILSILHTTVLSKTKDIGILKSIGGSIGGIMSIFMLNGLLMSVTGAGIGAGLGLAIIKNINAIQDFLERMVGFSLFPKDVYYLDRLPVDKEPGLSILVICVISILVSLLASAYPAWKASRMDAVEALRYE